MLAATIQVGIAAEALASVGIGLALLLVFREQDLSIFTETLGAEALSGGSAAAGLLAALAVGGWVFIGFDACVGASEETRNAARHVPRAIWIALLSVGALVILNAVAVTLAHPDPAAVVAGEDLDPVTTAVVSSFGSWSTKPFAAIVLVGLPGVRDRRPGAHGARDLLDRARRRAPGLAASCAGSTGAAHADRRDRGHGRGRRASGLLLGLDSTAVGSLIAFGTAAIYVAFLMVGARRADRAPARKLDARGHVQLGRAGTVVNVLAVIWLAFETVNIAWPRSLAGAAGRALLPGVGGAARARADRRRGPRLPGAGEAAPPDQRRVRRSLRAFRRRAPSARARRY